MKPSDNPFEHPLVQFFGAITVILVVTAIAQSFNNQSSFSPSHERCPLKGRSPKSCGDRAAVIEFGDRLEDFFNNIEVS